MHLLAALAYLEGNIQQALNLEMEAQVRPTLHISELRRMRYDSEESLAMLPRVSL